MGEIPTPHPLPSEAPQVGGGERRVRTFEPVLRWRAQGTSVPGGTSGRGTGTHILEDLSCREEGVQVVEPPAIVAGATEGSQISSKGVSPPIPTPPSSGPALQQRQPPAAPQRSPATCTALPTRGSAFTGSRPAPSPAEARSSPQSCRIRSWLKVCVRDPALLVFPPLSGGFWVASGAALHCATAVRPFQGWLRAWGGRSGQQATRPTFIALATVWDLLALV